MGYGFPEHVEPIQVRKARKQTLGQKLQVGGILGGMGVATLLLFQNMPDISTSPTDEEVEAGRATFTQEYQSEYDELSPKEQFEVTYVDPPTGIVQGGGLIKSLSDVYIYPIGGSECLDGTLYDPADRDDAVRITEDGVGLVVSAEESAHPDLSFIISGPNYGDIIPADPATSLILTDNHCN